MIVTTVRTPDRDPRPSPHFFRRPSNNADSIITRTPERSLHAHSRNSPSPSPLRRRTDMTRELQSPSRPVEPIPLSFGASRVSHRSPSAPLDLPTDPSRSPSEPQRRAPRTSTLSASINDISARTPMTRPPQLTLQDLNAPKAKRRSVEFGQSPLPRLVLTPPESKVTKGRMSQGRLPAPVFTSNKPILRRASTSPPGTPSLHTEDWFLNMSRNSDSMTKLSIHEPNDPNGVRAAPIEASPLSGKQAKATHLPSHLRHRRARSGEVKSTKRLSLGRIPDDVFDASSSSSPFAAITPLRETSTAPKPIVWQLDTDMPIGRDEIDPDVPPKPRSESLPDFFFPVERGIAQKRSTIGNTSITSRSKTVKAKGSRLSDEERPQGRESSIIGLSFEGEHDASVGDSSFASMTSLGSPRKGPSTFNFLAGLDDPTEMPFRFPPPPAATAHDQPMITPGFGPPTGSGWPGYSGPDAPFDSNTEEDEADMDAVLFNSLRGKQAARTTLPHAATKPIMPDTPVKHIGGRLGLSVQRAWQSTTKLGPSHKAKPPRKSLPIKFSPFARANKSLLDSPDSDAGDFPGKFPNQSPSPLLRPQVPLGVPRKSYAQNSPIGLGRPPSIPNQMSVSSSSPTLGQSGGLFGATKKKSFDLLSSMGIDKKTAQLMRRTSSSAWSISSESSSDGALGTPSRSAFQLGEWDSPRPSVEFPSTSLKKKNSGFLDSSPLTRRSSGRLPSFGRAGIPPSPPFSPFNGDSHMSSLNSTPSKPGHAVSPFHRTPSPLPSSPYWNDSDEEDLDDNIVLDYGIKEEPRRFETMFVSEDGLGQGSFGQAFRVTERPKLRSSTVSPKRFAVKKSKRYEGSKNRLRLLEEFDILRHLATTTTPRRSRSVSLSYPASAPMESPNVNVLQFIHGWEQDSMLCIQTELCELGTLSDFLGEYGGRYNRLDEPRVWKIMSEVGNGLLHIHHQNVIHLDLKPANIFVTIEGRLRIGDFGMASRWPRPPSFGSASEGFDREGDRAYLAPEILKGRYGREADIFSFGMIMLECAGNIVVPEQGDPWHRLRNQSFSDVDLAGFTPTLVDLIFRLMSPNPADRPLIDQVCAHDVVQKTRSRMLHNIEDVRRGSASLYSRLTGEELAAARREGEVAMFKASALGSEDETFLNEVFSGTTLTEFVESEAMDTTP